MYLNFSTFIKFFPAYLILFSHIQSKPQWMSNHLLHSLMNNFLKLLFMIWSSSFIIKNIQLVVGLICWETCLCYQRMQIQSDVQTMPGIRKSCHVLMCHCMLSLYLHADTLFSIWHSILSITECQSRTTDEAISNVVNVHGVCSAWQGERTHEHCSRPSSGITFWSTLSSH